MYVFSIQVYITQGYRNIFHWRNTIIVHYQVVQSFILILDNVCTKYFSIYLGQCHLEYSINVPYSKVIVCIFLVNFILDGCSNMAPITASHMGFNCTLQPQHFGFPSIFSPLGWIVFIHLSDNTAGYQFFVCLMGTSFYSLCKVCVKCLQACHICLTLGLLYNYP